MSKVSFLDSMKKARAYGMDEFLEIMGELSQESTKRGHIERKCKELITLAIALSKDCHRCIEIHTADAKRVGASDDELAQVRKLVLYLNASPSEHDQLWDSWEDAWRVFVLAKGPIPHASREMIALAIALVNQRKELINRHVESALAHGVSVEQVFEIMPIALLMDGAPALSQIPHLVAAIEEHQPALETA